MPGGVWRERGPGQLSGPQVLTFPSWVRQSDFIALDRALAICGGHIRELPLTSYGLAPLLQEAVFLVLGEAAFEPPESPARLAMLPGRVAQPRAEAVAAKAVAKGKL